MQRLPLHFTRSLADACASAGKSWTWVIVLVALALGSMATPLLATQVKDTRFSVKRGFFENPFVLELSTETDGATIRYTTDGSNPTASHGSIYAAPLIINSTTILRAAAFKEGLEPTDVDTQTYLFLDEVVRQTGAGFPATWGEFGTFGTEPGNHPPGPHPADYAMDPDVVDSPQFASSIKQDMKSIPSLSIVLNRDDLFSPEVVATNEEGEVTETRGIYLIGKGHERAASAELILPDGSSGFQINCSVEVQGATSTDRWKTDKLSMRLKFKSPYGPSELNYPLFGDDATDNINTVIIDATNQQAWTHPDATQHPRAQYVRDQFVGDLQNAMGGIAPHGQHAHVYLNGLYWGVYWLHEFVDESFCVAYLGGSKTDYDILRHRADNVVAGTAEDYQEMIALADAGLSSPAAYAGIQGYLDIPAFIDYMLVNYYGGNLDWAFQNWNASRNINDPEARWLFHNWDAEKTFQFITDDSTELNDPGSPTFLHQQLRANAEYRLLFADRLRLHCFHGGILTPAVVIQKYLQRVNPIDRAIVGESARWGDNRLLPQDPPYTRDTWLSEQDRLVNDYFSVRTDVLMNQMREDNLYPTLEAAEFGQHGGAVAPGFAVTISNPNAGGVIYFTTDRSDPRDPGGSIAASATVYSAAVTINESTQFQTRVYHPGTMEWSALTSAPFVVPSGISMLRVTELMFHPGETSTNEEAAGFDDTDNFEYLKVTNTGSESINLEGVHFSAGVRFTFPDVDLAPGSSVIVVNDLEAFEFRYGGGIAAIAGEFGGSLSNSGELIELRTRFDELIQSFSYEDSWCPPTDGEGYSLVVVDPNAIPALWDTPGQWRQSSFYGGSPATDDPEPAALRITEIHFHPSDPTSAEELAGFTDEESFEFIEIRNVSGSAINLQNHTLNGAVSFTFGDYVLSSGNYVLVVANQTAFELRHGPGLPVVGQWNGDLDNSGDGLLLGGPVGEVIQNFSYDDDWYQVTDGDGPSLVVTDELAANHAWSEVEQWRASVALDGSPGVADPVPPPDVRVVEIMYNPAEPSAEELAEGYNDNDEFEYLELENMGTSVINLQDFTLTGAVTFTFPDYVLSPGDRALVVEDRDAFEFRYGTDLPIIDEWSGGLNNTGEQMIFKDDLGNPILDFFYSDSWHSSTDGAGDSLEVVDTSEHPALWGDEDNWRPSDMANGTPGAAPNAWSSWKWDEFSDSEAADPAISGEFADPDKDGLPNLLEYALSSDPEDPDEAGADGFFLSSIEVDGNHYMTLTHQRNRLATDLSVTVEVSGNLIDWSSAPEDIIPLITTPVSATRELRTYRDVVPVSGTTKRYYRIRALRISP